MDLAQTLEPSRLHTEVDDALPPEERFMRLITLCFDRAVEQVAEEEQRTFKGLQSCAKEVVDEVVAGLKAEEFDKTAVEAPVLRPNPKNSQMRRNLQLYQTTRERLAAEERAWMNAVGEARAVVADVGAAAARIAAVADPSTAAATAATSTTTTTTSSSSRENDKEQSEKGQDDAIEKDIEAKVTAIERAAHVLQTVDATVKLFVANQHSTVAAQTAGKSQEGPTSLIRQITKTASAEEE